MSPREPRHEGMRIGRELRENKRDWIKNCSVEIIHWDHDFYV